jgi:hypothetical protein
MKSVQSAAFLSAFFYQSMTFLQIPASDTLCPWMFGNHFQASFSRKDPGFMFYKKNLNRLAVPLFLSAILCAGAQAAIRQDAASNGTWKDNATGLIWATRDNGSNVNYTQAGEYCSSLKSGGVSDWRLPTIDELETLYDRSVSKPYKAKGPLELGDACFWSGSMNNSGEVWTFYFTYGGRSLTRATGHSSYGRVLCVRAPKE